jgi:hypothetical protein
MMESQALNAEDDMDTATVDTNTGGRVRFTKDMPVRILELDGTLSTVVYLVDQERSDRKGYVSLKERDGTRMVRVHHRRVLPLSVDGRAVVVETGDRFWAMCPEDGQVIEVASGSESAVCPKCSKSFLLHWLGVRPMADAATKDKAKAPKPAAAATAEPKAEKAPRRRRRPPRGRRRSSRSRSWWTWACSRSCPHCELWTKKNVKFDHERIDVQAHVLLYTGEKPRKLCFNTYNGTLGKKATELPIESFIGNSKSKKDASWFPVEDVEKARAKLEKAGYSRQ